MDEEIVTAENELDFDGGWESEAFSEADSTVEEDAAGGRAAQESGETLEDAAQEAAPQVFPSPGGPLPAGSAGGYAPGYMRPDFLTFVHEHPEVSAADIPREVWERVSRGESLSAAWTRHENDSLRLRVMTMEQNEKNAARAAGSRVSAGKTKGVDPFDMGWDDDR